jgi:hypothetical protein
LNGVCVCLHTQTHTYMRERVHTHTERKKEGRGQKAPEKPALQRQEPAEALATAESASVVQLTHTSIEVAAKVVE